MERDLLCFDLETTGTNIAKDRIVQIAITDGVNVQKFLCNPGIPIPEEASAVHGIYDKDVAGAAMFKDIAPLVHEILSDADLIGFNQSNYDIPLLWEEFFRAGIDWDLSNTKILDAGTLFKKREERTLSAAYKFYLGKEMVDAHDAASDALATIEIWNEQLRRYGLDKASRETLAKESSYDESRIDLAGKIVKGKDGRPTYNLGKAKGVAVVDDPGFGNWTLRNDFTENTKRHLRSILGQS